MGWQPYLEAEESIPRWLYCWAWALLLTISHMRALIIDRHGWICRHDGGGTLLRFGLFPTVNDNIPSRQEYGPIVDNQHPFLCHIGNLLGHGSYR